MIGNIVLLFHDVWSWFPGLVVIFGGYGIKGLAEIIMIYDHIPHIQNVYPIVLVIKYLTWRYRFGVFPAPIRSLSLSWIGEYFRIILQFRRFSFRQTEGTAVNPSLNKTTDEYCLSSTFVFMSPPSPSFKGDVFQIFISGSKYSYSRGALLYRLFILSDIVQEQEKMI